MYPRVVTSDPKAVEAEVQSANLEIFPKGDQGFVGKVFGWAKDFFTGGYGNYQAVDACYHDFEHTLQGTLCLARLLRGRSLAKAEPVLTQRMFELGLLAMLMHDSGYLKQKDDNKGTGAKYTVMHVRRSAEFAAKLLGEKGFDAREITAVQNMILCTGFNESVERIPFQSETERVIGQAMGTADFLGQMAADDYVEKLPMLYAEFAEAARHPHEETSNVGMFTSSDDLIQKTPGFWENYVRPKLEKDFGGLWRFLSEPYPAGRNGYVERVEANLDGLRRKLAARPGASR